jgi:hypothetical protein
VLGTIFRAPLKFFQTYFVHRGFLDGWAGLQVSILSACYVAIKEAKLWEYEHAEPQPVPAPLAAGLRLFDPSKTEETPTSKSAERKAA